MSNYIKILRYLEACGLSFDDLGWLGPEKSVRDLSAQDAFYLWESICGDDEAAEHLVR